MKKVVVMAISVLLIFGMGGIANAALITSNLLVNPGFEIHTGNDFAGWAEGGASVQAVPFPTQSGSTAAFLGVSTENLFQSFALPSNVNTLVYGAYFKIYTNTLSGNWDQAQISMQVAGNGSGVIGGSIANFGSIVGDPNLFTFDAGLGAYVSPWFLLYGTIDTSAVGLTTAGINISLQNYADPLTKLFVDDAFAGQATVPEPSTLLLLGSGLVGLVGYRRRKRMM
jgi:hypothetical protein